MIAGTLASSVVLASCGSDDDATVEPAAAPEATQAPATETVVVTQAPPEAAPETQEPAPEETSEEPAATEEDAGDEGSGSTDVPEGATAPGTELKIGEPATVMYKSGGEAGLINVTVTSIDKGKESDLDELDLGDKAAGLTPYYVNIEVEGADSSAKNLEFSSMIGAIDGLLADGSDAQTLSVIGDFKPCPYEDLGEFDEGVKIETCDSFLAGGDSEVTGAQFAAYDSPYDSYDGDPIVWTE